MKIAVWHNLPSGGGKRALYYHVRGLVERGHVVEAWCPPTADRAYLPLEGLVQEHVVPYPFHPRVHRDPFTRAVANYTNVVSKLAALEAHCRTCARSMEQKGFQILLAAGDRDFLAPPIGKATSLPSVLYLQEPSRVLYEAMPKQAWAALPSPRRWTPAYGVRFVHNLIKVQALRVQVRDEQVNAAAFTRILVNSLYSRESVLRAYGLDSRVCYLGVDTDLFRPEGKTRQPFVLSVGAFIPTKNPEFIIRSIGAMPEPRPKLVWVGNAADGAYREKMEAVALSLGVTLELRVGISDPDLVDLLNTAGVLAYAPRLEPFGYAPLEANACGLPVVAVAEGGVRETVENGVNGLLVPPEPGAMAYAIARILGDREYAERLGAQARETVLEKWSLAASIDRLEAHLAEALTQEGSAR